MGTIHVSDGSNGRNNQTHALIHESLFCMRKFSQLVPDHVLRNRHRDVVFSVVHEKPNPTNLCQVQASNPIPFLGVTNVKPIAYPIKFGRMVHERASVFIGVLFASASRMLGNATKNGPASRLASYILILELSG
jgi:hypothetical protein